MKFNVDSWKVVESDNDVERFCELIRRKFPSLYLDATPPNSYPSVIVGLKDRSYRGGEICSYDEPKYISASSLEAKMDEAKNNVKIMEGLCAAAEGIKCSPSKAHKGEKSEIVESPFYMWTKKNIRKLLSKEDAEAFFAAYNITVEGGFEEPNPHSYTGKHPTGPAPVSPAVVKAK